MTKPIHPHARFTDLTRSSVKKKGLFEMELRLVAGRGHQVPAHKSEEPLIFPTAIVIHGVGAMPVEVDGRLIDDMTIQLDQPLKSGEERVVVRLRKHPKKKDKTPLLKNTS